MGAAETDPPIGERQDRGWGMAVPTRPKSFFAPIILVLAVAVTALFGASAGHAVMTDYQREQITQYLHSPKTDMAAGIFDGQSFDASVSVNDAASYMNGFIDTMNRAVQEWNKLTSGAAGSDEGQALFKELNDKLNFAKAMRDAFPTFQANQNSQSEPQTSTAEADSADTTSADSGSAESSGEAATAADAPAETGGMTDYQKQQLTQYLDSNAMRKDTSIFDGERFVAGVPFEAFEQYYQGYMKNLEQAISAWERQISSSSKSTPDGQALMEQLNGSIEWANAMNAQYAATKSDYQTQQQAEQAAQQQAATAAAQNEEAHKQQCRAFQDAAMKPLSRDPMIRLINQMLHQNSGLGSVEGVEQHRQVASEVRGVCQAVDYDLIASAPCFYVLGRPDHDPVHWCGAAAQADDLIRAAVLNQAQQTIEIVGSSTIQSVSEFHEREGWLTMEGPVTFNDKLFFSAHGREAVMENVGAVLLAAGIDDAEGALWGEQKARLDTLRAEVEKTAGTWQSPAKEADNYSTALAAEQILEWHGDAEVRDAYLSRESWKIHTNEIGVPDRRTLPGYVLFKLPDDPFCQLRSYTLTEQYAGGGTYQPAGGVRFGYVRFQACS